MISIKLQSKLHDFFSAKYLLTYSFHPRKTTLSKSIILRHGCSPVRLLHIFRTPFAKNTSGRLHISLAEKESIFIDLQFSISNVFSNKHIDLQFSISNVSSNKDSIKMKFSINRFFTKCNEIHRKLRTSSHLLKKSLLQNFIFFVQRNT